MRRIERVEVLRSMLSQREFWTVGELANKLHVSVRTLFRDLQYLREIGLDIDADRGLGGGVRLMTNWSSRKIDLSESQTMRLLVGLAVMDKLELPFFASGKSTTQVKLLSGVPRALSQNLVRLKSRVFIGGNASAVVKNNYLAPKANCLSMIEKAFVALSLLEIEYIDEKLQRTTRVVEPHGLIVNWPAWYLLTFDYLRNEVRMFRLDRVTSARVLVERKFRVRAQEIFDQILGQEFGEPL